jgi:hypothetical protein
MTSVSIPISAAGSLYQRHRGAFLFFLAAFAVYATAALQPPVGVKHYLYLADAFLHGSLSVQNPPSELIEVIPFQGGNYLAYGVMPAIVLLPFVAIWGLAVDQGLVLAGMGAINAALMYRLLRRLECDEWVSAWLTALFAFGTVHFHASILGSTWYFSQICGIFFLLMAIHEVLGRNRGIITGLLLGAAVLSRNTLLLAAPFFLIIMNVKGVSWLRIGGFASGLLICLVADGWYNFARFGSVVDNGYHRMPYSPPYGMFSWHYLKHNLYTYLVAPPEWIRTFPYLRPSLHGMSLFLTTPAFLFIFRALKFNALTAAAWLPVAVIGSLYLLFYGDGYSQFGVRYSLDYTPFLMILTAIGCGRTMKFPSIPLIVLSILVNLWGVAWWKFGSLNWDGT